MRASKKIVIAYVPVLHAGYMKFFRRHHDAEKLLVLGTEITDEHRDLVKDIRALDPGDMLSAIKHLRIFPKVVIATKAILTHLAGADRQIVMPSEGVSRAIAGTYLAGKPILFDSIFLRWDKDSILTPHTPDPHDEISREQFDRSCIDVAKRESLKSPDWWRQVGGLIVKDGEVVLTAFNRHVPGEHTASEVGDPRASFTKGVHIELGVALHAEAGLIATAAGLGIGLRGAHIYTTTFPCPPCAKLIAYSGIARVYFEEGYSLLDGEFVLRAHGVRITRVVR